VKATTALSKALVASVLFGAAAAPLLLTPSPLGHDLPPVSPSGRHQKKVARQGAASGAASGAADGSAAASSSAASCSVAASGDAASGASGAAGDAGAADEDEGAWPVLATLVNIHTGEVVVLDEQEPSIARWSALLHDRVTGATTPMAPEPLGMVRQVARRHAGARVELVSGFRSPKLNEVLRKKGHRVASHSQHSLGHAVDFRVVGMSPAEMRAEVRGLGWKGGVGQYDKPTDRFIHIDIGRDRSWRE
jgi:uncharacterized protein YcbK (DUF882 family)